MRVANLGICCGAIKLVARLRPPSGRLAVARCTPKAPEAKSELDQAIIGQHGSLPAAWQQRPNSVSRNRPGCPSAILHNQAANQTCLSSATILTLELSSTESSDYRKSRRTMLSAPTKDPTRSAGTAALAPKLCGSSSGRLDVLWVLQAAVKTTQPLTVPPSPDCRFAVLLALAYPLALVSAIIYAILSPLILIDCCKPTIEALRNLLDLPLRCVRNMVEAKQLFVM